MSKRSEAKSQLPTRFYRAVEVSAHANGHAVLLDGRMPKSPARSPLVVPTRPLAERLAREWDAQVEEIDALTMPTVRLAYTAIDRIPMTRGAVAEEVSRFGGSDVICHFADSPADLVEAEERAWTPWIDWAGTALGVTLQPVSGVTVKAQEPKALARLRTLAAAEDDFALAGLAFGAALFGSAVLAFAVRRGAVDAVTALEISWVDETFQAARWGVDEEAEARREALRAEAIMLQGWFEDLSTQG